MRIQIPSDITSLSLHFDSSATYIYNTADTVNGSSLYFVGKAQTCPWNGDVTLPNGLTHFQFGMYNSGSSIVDGCNFTTFNGAINKPNTVTNFEKAYSGLSNFNRPVDIPATVTSLYGTFENCHKFNQSVTISENVTNMYKTFANAHRFNQPMTIPNTVTNVSLLFANCNNLTQHIVLNINNSMDTLNGTFANCNALKWVSISANFNNVKNMTNMFEGCHSLRYIRFNNDGARGSDYGNRSYSWIPAYQFNNVNFTGFLKGRTTTDPLLTIMAREKDYDGGSFFNKFSTQNLFGNGLVLSYTTLSEYSSAPTTNMIKNDSELSLELGIAAVISGGGNFGYMYYRNNSSYNLCLMDRASKGDLFL